MNKLYRFGISLERRLIDAFDRHIRRRKYDSRSEAIRDLIRQELVRKEWAEDSEVVGAITLAYNHHRRDLANAIMDIQHDRSSAVISTQHIHLDHDNCLEIVAVRGKARDVQELSDRLRALKGVKHVTLNMSTTGKHLR